MVALKMPTGYFYPLALLCTQSALLPTPQHIPSKQQCVQPVDKLARGGGGGVWMKACISTQGRSGWWQNVVTATWDGEWWGGASDDTGNYNQMQHSACAVLFPRWCNLIGWVKDVRKECATCGSISQVFGCDTLTFSSLDSPTAL